MKPSVCIREIAILALAAAAMLAGTSGAAKEVYRWVDDNGTVHFSDTKPIDDDAAVTTLEIAEFQSDYDPTEDPYSILNQAARTHERWQAIEDARRERLERQAATVAPTSYSTRDDSRYLDVGYYGYPPLGPGYPGRNPSRLARQQYRALSALDLTGPRPYSINSTEHRARVERSQYLPLVPPLPPLPTPR